MTELDLLPGWLEIPPVSKINPPVDTLVDELPVHELRWDDFERLCLRIARTEADVVGARLYGTAGQVQEGIDLYARVRGTDTYRVYQCKKVEEFAPAVIRGAIDLFLNGEWALRTHHLVLCTTDSVRTTQRADEVESQTARLAADGITLEVWAREDISEKLRSEPMIVFEFFGPAWVERFCGPHHLEQLTAARTRLDPAAVVNLRTQLRRLYSNVFTTHDPGLTIAQQDSPVGLYERYILPDLNDYRTATDATSDPGSSAADAESFQDQSQIDLQEPGAFDLPEGPSYGRRRHRARPTPRRRRSQRQRTTIEAFFAGEANARYVVLGGPGSGKSALLRFLTLDLLSDAPQLSGLARIWGRHLPVWIPFGAWVQQTKLAGRAVPLSEMLRSWLALWEEADLWPLVERALEDRRLLLLVDGLDEWESEDSARIALTQVNVFAAQRDTPVIFTSRPHGFSRLAAEFPAWNLGELAAFTRRQQIALARAWFTKWLNTDISSVSDQGNSSQARVDQRALQMAREFVEDLGQSPDLEELAEVPLLLSVLILLRYQNAALPDDRFRAYGALTEQLISIWPRRRRAAALMREARKVELRDDEREQAYAFLAFRMHMDAPSGVLEQSRARTHMETFLQDDNIGPGFTEEDASRVARDLINVGEFVSGILVKRSPREIGFYHRALQEYLAAQYLAALPQEEQLQFVSGRATDVLWREVILTLLSMTRSQSAVAAIVAQLQGAVGAAAMPERLHLAEILAETAAGPFSCPIVLSRELTSASLQSVAEFWWMPHRERLLRILLGGFRSRRLRSMLLPQVRQWFPSRVEYRSSLLSTIAEWPEADEAYNILWRNLLQEESSDAQLTAVRLIAKRWAGDPNVQRELLALTAVPVEPMIRAAALLAVLEGWGADQSFRRVLAAPGNDLHAEIRYLQVRLRLMDGEQDEALATELLGQLSILHGVDYAWREMVKATIIEHLPGDRLIRKICLARVRKEEPDPQSAADIDYREAWDLLLEGYPQDDLVVEAIVEELRSEYPQLETLDWSALAKNFRDHPRLVEALDQWMDSNPKYHELETAGAALVGRTPIGKRALLRGLESGTPFWSARALLDGWGMEDPEVREHLTAKVWASNTEASLIALFLPRVLADPERSYQRLLELLRDGSALRTDFVISGLHQLGRIAGNPDVVNAVLTRISHEKSSDLDWGMIGQIIVDAPEMPGVRELALAQLSEPDGPHAAVAHAFGREPEIRARLLEMVMPLPQHLRIITADFFRNLHFPDPELTEVCHDYSWDSDPEVMTAGAIAYFRRVRSERDLRSEEVDDLRRMLRSGGITYEERRQAAAAALIEIGQETALEEEVETVGEAVPVRVPLRGSIWGANRPLADLIVERWEDLEKQFNDRVLQRFNDTHKEPTEQALARLWDLLAPQADENPRVVSLLMRFAERKSAAKTGPNILRFLARQRPRTLLVRDRCLGALHQPTGDWDHTSRLFEVAADVLALQFADDETLWEELSAELAEHPWAQGPIVALARAKPDAPALRRVAEQSDEEVSERLPANVYFRLRCATSSADVLLKFLESYLGSLSRQEQRIFQWLYRPLVERLRRDEVLTAALKELVRRSESRPLIAALISALAGVPGALSTEELRAELHKEQETDTGSAGGATLGYDLRLGRLRPFAHILLDTLEQATSR